MVMMMMRDGNSDNDDNPDIMIINIIIMRNYIIGR